MYELQKKKTGYNTMLYIIFQHGWEWVLIYKVSIGFEAILEIDLHNSVNLKIDKFWEIIVKDSTINAKINSTSEVYYRDLQGKDNDRFFYVHPQWRHTKLSLFILQ